MELWQGKVRAWMAVLVTLALLGWSAAAPAQADDVPLAQLLQEAQTLLAAGRAERAWQRLSPREFEFAGEVAFDYHLGLAALDSGRTARATLAFERVLAVRPNHAGARMGIARAYFAMRDYERARAEFETLREMRPPERARVAIQRYLDAIDDRTLPPVRTRWTAHVSAGAGYDSNVNNATANETVAIPALGGAEFSLDPDSLETDDGYMRIGAGAEVNHALRENLAVFGGVDASMRRHLDESDFDTQRGEVRTGLRLRNDDHFLSVGLSRGQLRVDGNTNRRTHGLNAEWRYLISARDQVGVFGQANRFRHPGALDVQDANQFLGGVSWLRNISLDGRTRISGTLLGGVDNEQGGRTDGDKTIYGVRAGVQHLLQPDLLMVVSAGYREDHFDEDNPLFNTERRDRPRDVSLSLDWRPLADWSIQPRISYTDYSSNIAINEFERVDVSLGIRREFR